MTEIAGKTALITGGAMGMGRLLAETLARDGARKLVLWDINEEQLAEAKDVIEGFGAEVFTYVIDITDRDKVRETAKKVKEDVGHIDILVNNAGIVRGGLFLEVSDEDHLKTMEVNIISYFYVTKAFMPEMVERNQGHIVNIASAAGLIGLPGVSSYCASKFAVVGWTESLRSEMRKLGKLGINFTTICPSFVSTGMFEGVKPPMFTPMITPEYMVGKIHAAIRKNKMMVMEPFMVKTIPSMRLLNIPVIIDLVGGLLGMHNSMDEWKGHPDIS